METVYKNGREPRQSDIYLIMCAAKENTRGIDGYVDDLARSLGEWTDDDRFKLNRLMDRCPSIRDMLRDWGQAIGLLQD